MGMKDTLATLFTGTPPSPAQPINPVHPMGTTIPANAGQTAPATPGTAPNGTVPVDTANKTTAALDEYKDIWKNDTDPNAPPVDNTIFGEVNGDELLAAAQKIDFTKVITPEIQAAIAQGGEAGTQALIQALNKTVQLGHAQSAHATTKIVELAIAKAQEKFNAQIPDVLRTQNAADLIKEDPVLSHPAVAPMVAGLMTQLAKKFPDSSPAELNKQAQAYVKQFATSILDTQGDPAAVSANNKDIDWEKWFQQE